MKKIYVFICSILLFCVFPVAGKKKTNVPDTIPLVNDIYIGVDMINPISMIFGTRYTGLEVSGDIDLKHRYFPVVELGVGKYEKQKDGKDGLYFDMTGMYGRLGLNYNIFNNSQGANIGFVGFRYGYAFEEYQYKNLRATDPYWGTETQLDNFKDDAHTHWCEVLAGVRVHIYWRISMGWIFRYKFKIGQTKSKYGETYYVPGYGKNENKNAGFTYSLYYSF